MTLLQISLEKPLVQQKLTHASKGFPEEKGCKGSLPPFFTECLSLLKTFPAPLRAAYIPKPSSASCQLSSPHIAPAGGGNDFVKLLPWGSSTLYHLSQVSLSNPSYLVIQIWVQDLLLPFSLKSSFTLPYAVNSGRALPTNSELQTCASCVQAFAQSMNYLLVIYTIFHFFVFSHIFVVLIQEYALPLSVQSPFISNSLTFQKL